MTRSFFSALTVLSLIVSACGDNDSDPDGSDGAGTGGTAVGTGGDMATGGGENGGTGGTEETGGTGGGTTPPNGTILERATNLDAPAELAIALTLCESGKVNMLANSDATEEGQGYRGRGVVESNLNEGATTTLNSVFSTNRGNVDLSWATPATDPDNTPASGQIVWIGSVVEDKCFTGVAALSKTIGGKEYYAFVANQFADGTDEGCEGITPSTLGLTHGCISRDLF